MRKEKTIGESQFKGLSNTQKLTLLVNYFRHAYNSQLTNCEHRILSQVLKHGSLTDNVTMLSSFIGKPVSSTHTAVKSLVSKKMLFRDINKGQYTISTDLLKYQSN